MNLDIEKVRLFHESNRHWAVRKHFLCHNWGNVDTTRLNSLSLCWTNNIFYGNKYPIDVTEIIRELLHGMPSVSSILDEEDKVHSAQTIGRKRRISQERDETISISNEKRLKLPAKFQPMIFHKGESTFNKTYDGDKSIPDQPAKVVYATPEVEPEVVDLTNCGSNAKSAATLVPSGGRSQHNKPTHFHISVIQRLKVALNQINHNVPYAVDIAAKRINEAISVGIYQCGENLFDIKKFIQSKKDKLYYGDADVELFKFSKYAVVSLRGVELGYGFGKNARRLAFDNAERLLREQYVFVISALRLSGIRSIAQFTISQINKNYDMGYLPPMHLATVSRGVTEEKIEKIDQLTLFLHEGIVNPYTIIGRSASLNRVSLEYREQLDQESLFSFHLYMGDVFIADGSGTTKKDAKHNCCENAIEAMKEKCTVFNERIKAQSEGALSIDEIKKCEIETTEQPSTKPSTQPSTQDIKKDKGAMLMKLMGWSGGGLGKNESGRVEIVKVFIASSNVPLLKAIC